ncbi:MAG TPA: ATPase [Clostridiales bacterium]|nr:ATPase [Clostridiales bacterium]
MVMNMKRKIMEDLKKWKEEQSKMPYMLVGARQVGKTYILDNFCKDNYKKYVYINLEKEDNIREIFENSLDPERIISSIAIIKGKRIVPEETIVFLDEIQISERAITALKYFNESEVRYHIACAGSLLGVALNRFKSSFPVGKVHRKYLYSMDFEEFLWALGEEMLTEEIREGFKKDRALMEPIHEKAMNIYRDYLFVGGMPASVLEYIKNKKDLSRYDRIIKKNIIGDYIADMTKYTTNAENIRINEVYKSIPKQLGRDNNKFSYTLVDEKGNKRMYETSIEWLINSNLVNKCVLVKTPQIPLTAYEEDNYFKIYLNDVGLLTELSNMTPYDIVSESSNLYRGMLTENYVAQTLASGELGLNYWRSSNVAEIDFVLSIQGTVIPIEVKSATNTKSKSLNVYKDKYKPKYAIKISGKNFGFVNGIKSVPLYAAYMIKEIDKFGTV